MRKIRKINEAYWQSDMSPEKRRKLAEELIKYLREEVKEKDDKEKLGLLFMHFCGDRGLSFTEARDLDKEVGDMSAEMLMLGDLSEYIEKIIKELFIKYGNGKDDIYDKTNFLKYLNKKIDWLSNIYDSPSEIENLEKVRNRFENY